MKTQHTTNNVNAKLLKSAMAAALAATLAAGAVAGFTPAQKAFAETDAQNDLSVNQTTQNPSWLPAGWEKVFDLEYYMKKYPNVAVETAKNSQADAKAIFEYFKNVGMAQGQQAHPDFDVHSYYNRYKDLRAQFGLDLAKYYEHYVTQGAAQGLRAKGVSYMSSFLSTFEGIDYSPVYGGRYYYFKHADVQQQFTQQIGGKTYIDDRGMLEHFVKVGMAQARSGSFNFNVANYKALNPQVTELLGKVTNEHFYMHYLQTGKAQGLRGI